MSKVRVCTKCGKVENQFTFFCTERGWKTELRDSDENVSQKMVSNENKETINREIELSSDTIAFKPEKVDLGDSNSSEVIENKNEKRDSKTQFSYRPLERVVEPIDKLDVADKIEVDEYVDVECPHCNARLSYMRWELQGTLTCPMCNENFLYSEETGTTVLNEVAQCDDFCELESTDSFFETVCPHCNSTLSFPKCDFDESELVCPICNQRIAFEDSISFGGAEERENISEERGRCDEHVAEIDPMGEEEFVDVFCPRCGSKLSFPEWQIKEELVCPMCEATFRMG